MDERILRMDQNSAELYSVDALYEFFGANQLEDFIE
jgi:hypothetical protein